MEQLVNGLYNVMKTRLIHRIRQDRPMVKVAQHTSTCHLLVMGQYYILYLGLVGYFCGPKITGFGVIGMNS